MSGLLVEAVLPLSIMSVSVTVLLARSAPPSPVADPPEIVIPDIVSVGARESKIRNVGAPVPRLTVTWPDPGPAQEAVSYARHIKPFLAKYCLECHNSKEAKSGLNLETYQSLRTGSDAGEVVMPGEANKSVLVLLVEGKDTPKMPPKSARQPKPAEVCQEKSDPTVKPPTSARARR